MQLSETFISSNFCLKPISIRLYYYYYFTGTQPLRTKTAKNAKKNVGKGKKKNSNPKTDVTQTLEANGPLDKNKVTAE